MEPFIGEIRLFAGNFAPRGWAFCNGQVLPISANTALFSILGTIYGGDGKSSFALPDLRGRAPMHQGAGPGLTPRSIGETRGTATVTLTAEQMPAHAHTAYAAGGTGEGSPVANAWGGGGRRSPDMYSATADTDMKADALTPAGSGQPHNNRQPCLGLNFIIALEGVFPPRS